MMAGRWKEQTILYLKALRNRLQTVLDNNVRGGFDVTSFFYYKIRNS
jgi:hypothetical protein